MEYLNGMYEINYPYVMSELMSGGKSSKRKICTVVL